MGKNGSNKIVVKSKMKKKTKQNKYKKISRVKYLYGLTLYSHMKREKFKNKQIESFEGPFLKDIDKKERKIKKEKNLS